MCALLVFRTHGHPGWHLVVVLGWAGRYPRRYVIKVTGRCGAVKFRVTGAFVWSPGRCG